jgi:DNA (cytosine-5)-methyltransferase 1
MYTHGSLFAGIDGFGLAFEAAGFVTRWQSEIDPYCCKLLMRRFPNAAQLGDIHAISHPPYVDVITAGFPCQPFSVAGKKRGKDDERYLVPEMLRVIQEVGPRVFLLENVPGFRTINDGAEFRELLRQIAKIGYDAEWDHFRASDVGAPHRRERLFIVGHSRRQRLERWQGKPGDNGAQQPTIKRSGYELAHTRRANGKARKSYRLGTGKSSGKKSSPPHCDCTLAHTKSRSRRYVQGVGSQKSIARNGTRKESRQTQPRLGGNANGLPYRLDRHQWPAPPGPQYAWEPPRTTDTIENRAARLKALGNAVVPQIVYPIACAIWEWLSNEDDK